MMDLGPTDAKIMLVGDMPSNNDFRNGEYFSSSSGQLLKQMLSHVGINFSNCYVTNIVDTIIRGGIKSLYKDKRCTTPSSELLEYWDNVKDKINRIKPNVVIALGAEPLRAILNRRGIEKNRGSIYYFNEVKVIATYHPSYVLKVYNTHPIVELDLSKAKRHAEDTKLSYYKPKIKLSPNVYELEFWIREAKKKGRVAFDIETIGNHVRCISLAVAGDKKISSIIIPFIKFPSSSMARLDNKNIISVGTLSDSATSYWTQVNEVRVLDMLSDLMEDEAVQKVGHNSISFDAPIIKKEFKIDIKNHYLDTMHAFHLLYSDLPKGLKFCNTIMTDYPNYWSDKITTDDRSEWTYCCYDSASTLSISYNLEKELIAKSMLDKYKEINELAISLARIEDRGILIDKEVRDEIIKKQKKELEEIKKNFESGFNPNSPKQVGELLYIKKKFPTIYKDGRPTTDEAAIQSLVRKYPNAESLRNIIRYRKIYKLISTFLEVELDEDGKIRTSYCASGTKNGRLNSSKRIDGSGMNLQNIPVGKGKGIENIRNIFIPSKGKILVKADLSQAEALVVAEILTRYGDYTLAEKHKDPNFDVHRWTASKTLGTKEEDVNKKDRSIGKLANHSGNYVAGPGVMVKKALKEELYHIDYQLAKRVLDARHKAIPGLKKWWRDVEKTLLKCRKIKTCLNRERIFFGRLDNTTLRDAVAFEPQSIVADVTNKMLSKIELNPNSKLTILMQVHDEIVGECYEEELDEVINEIKIASRVPLNINPKRPPLVIPIDIEVGYNWKDTKLIGG